MSLINLDSKVVENPLDGQVLSHRSELVVNPSVLHFVVLPLAFQQFQSVFEHVLRSDVLRIGCFGQSEIVLLQLGALPLESTLDYIWRNFTYNYSLQIAIVRRLRIVRL